jgi:hypothetical protein
MRTSALPLPALARLARLVCLVSVASGLGACNMDGAASNPEERQTHMGDIHAAAPPATVSAAAGSSAVAPAAAPPAAPAPSSSH